MFIRDVTLCTLSSFATGTFCKRPETAVSQAAATEIRHPSGFMSRSKELVGLAWQLTYFKKTMILLLWEIHPRKVDP